ncbi:MAG: response regulator transcription factor [Bacteroidales bacterium]|nr:response regulator transcription factor [Bacteroidales bacterium]
MSEHNLPINLLIVDDHQLIIDGLRSLFAEDERVEIVGGVTSGNEALKFLTEHAVDVVLADINMPKMSGIELTYQIRNAYPNIYVLALTMHDDSTLISKMIEAGASGYVLKSTNMNELVDAISAVARKEKYLSRDVQTIIMGNIYNSQDAITTIEPNVVKLTPRETEILNLIAREYTNEQIADMLFISERTVETHRKNIFTKTSTRSIVGLMKYAMNHNLINMEEEQ